MLKNSDLQGSIEISGIEDAGLAYQKYNFQGFSSDVDKLPTERVGAGSTFLTLDTREVYIFHGKTQTWY